MYNIEIEYKKEHEQIIFNQHFTSDKRLFAYEKASVICKESTPYSTNNIETSTVCIY